MACGLPVVAWDLEMYSGMFPQGMLRVPEGDRRAFSDSTVRVLDDPDLYAKLSREAREYGRRYTWTSIPREELKILKRVVNE